jgi:hypothetical protein
MMTNQFFLRVAGVSAVGVLAVGITPVCADTLQTTEPSISVGSVTSSNPQLFSENARQGSGVVATLDIPFEWRHDTWSWSTSPMARVGSGSGDAAVSKSLFSVGSQLENKTERSDVTVGGSYLSGSNAAQEPNAGTLTRVDVQTRVYGSQLGWTQQLTERVDLNVHAASQKLEYNTTSVLGLYSYRYLTGGAQLSAAISEHERLVLSEESGQYEVTGLSAKDKSTSMSAGLRGQAGELWSYQLLGGLNRIQANGSPQTNSFTYSVTGSRAFERASISLSATRTPQPSGFGTLATTQSESLRATFKGTERLTYTVSGRWDATSNSSLQILLPSRNYHSFAAGVAWRMTPVWDLTADFNWSQVQTNASLFSLASTAHANGVSLTVVRRFGSLHLY